jgi:L-2,4-diaminobutyric acid acetyltransferase
MWALADRTGLDLNSPYAYVLWGDRFASSSLIAEDPSDPTPLGFVMGFRPPEDDDTLFVWQIGVDERARGRGLAARMLDHLVVELGISHVEATVTPSNTASAALFRGLGTRHDAPVVEELAYGEDLFPGGHEAEVRFRIGPIGQGGSGPGASIRRPPRGDSS